MTAVKEKKALPHCSRETSARILELRDSVRELSKEIAGIQLKYHSPITSKDDREKLAQNYEKAKEEITCVYKELLRTIIPIVQNAPESREDPINVATEEHAAGLYHFWRSYFEYPAASWNLANLCMKLAEFKERAGEPEKALLHYKQAISRCNATAEIIRGSGLNYKAEEKMLIDVENLQLKAATKACDEQEEKRLNASRAVRMAFFVGDQGALKPHPNVSHLLSMYYGPEIEQKDLTPLLQAYFNFSQLHSEKKKQTGKFSD